jgi:hypothetical protein
MTTMTGRGFGAGMPGFEHRETILTGADGVSVKVPPMGVGVVAVQALIGFAVYMAACLWYVIETGVDCL